MGGKSTFLEEFFELCGEFLAHVRLWEVVLEESEDIFRESCWFCVAAVGLLAVEGDEEEN